MKIAVWHNLPSGGGKRALFDHVSGLVEAGHEVEVWAPPTSDRDYLPLGDLAPEHIVPLDFPHGMTWRERWNLSAYVARGIRAMDEHCRRCAAEIDAGGFDVLFANACQYSRTTAIGRLSKTPSTIYLGEPYRWLYEAMPDNRWAALAPETLAGLQGAKKWFIDRRDTWGARVQVREEIRNAKAFDLILCNSFFSRESILRAYGVDSAVCYLGIDGTLFQAAQREPAGHVIGLGAFTLEKNVELAIRAIGAMPGERPPLVWVGNVADPAYLAAMTALAEALGVNFQPRQRISDAELLDLMSTATAMIYAPRLEPFGLAPLEANACGVPVVAVAEGGVRETVVDGVNGLLADASPEALGAALARLRDDPALARRLGETGRQRVADFWSKDQGTARLTAYLQQVAASKR